MLLELVLPRISNTTSPPVRHISLVVVDKHFTILAISTWLFLRHTNRSEDGFCLHEDGVHLFKRSIGCLRVEVVDYWEDEGVDGREDDVGPIVDALEGDRCLVHR